MLRFVKFRRLWCYGYSRKIFSRSGSDGGEALQKALSDAEKIVGFPTSLLSLRGLLSDEFGGLAIHLRKLISTRHPLLNTARRILFDSKNYMQTRGLVMLLVSKASEKNSGIVPMRTHVQLQSLAEITELIHLGFLVHRGVVDRAQIAGDISKTDADLGNKLAVLGGDFMLANACASLAKLENTNIVDTISASIADISLSLVMLPENRTSHPIQNLKNIPTDHSGWVKAIQLAKGSLLGKACRAALLLRSAEAELLTAAEQFAYSLVLAQQARHDIMRFKSLEVLDNSPNFCCLCSLPAVLMAQENGGRDFLEMFMEQDDKGNFKIQSLELYNAVAKQKHTLKSAKKICLSHADAALRNLLLFPACRARSALENIVISVKM